MNESEFDKLFDSSLFRAIESIKKQAGLADGFSHITRLKKPIGVYEPSMAISESRWLETTIKTIKGYRNRLHDSFPQLDYIISISKLTEINHQASYAASYACALGSAHFTSFQANLLQQTEIFSDVYKQLSMSDAFAFARHNRQLLKLASKAYGFESLNIIANLKNSPLNENEEYQQYEVDGNDANFYQEDIYTLDKIIETGVRSSDDFEKLPPSLKNKIYKFIKFSLITILINIFSNFTYDQVKSLEQRLRPLTTTAEVKQQARKMTSLYDKEILSGLRFITKNNVSLREAPSMKSGVILFLEIGSVVRIIDKSNRTWLLVEIEDGDDFVQGWVSRKYTKYFK